MNEYAAPDQRAAQDRIGIVAAVITTTTATESIAPISLLAQALVKTILQLGDCRYD
jgi:hypothetical protein